MPSRDLIKRPAAPKIQAPERLQDWKALLRQAIQRAESTQDRRLEGLKHALATDNAEAHLRRLGIIHPGDLLREFSEKSTP